MNDREKAAKEWLEAESEYEQLSIKLAAAKLRRDQARNTMVNVAGPLKGVLLTSREKQVLEGIRDDLQNKEIAARLNISERTVKFHVSSILLKCGVHFRTELMGEK